MSWQEFLKPDWGKVERTLAALAAVSGFLFALFVIIIVMSRVVPYPLEFFIVVLPGILVDATFSLAVTFPALFLAALAATAYLFACLTDKKPFGVIKLLAFAICFTTACLAIFLAIAAFNQTIATDCAQDADCVKTCPSANSRYIKLDRRSNGIMADFISCMQIPVCRSGKCVDLIQQPGASFLDCSKLEGSYMKLNMCYARMIDETEDITECDVLPTDYAQPNGIPKDYRKVCYESVYRNSRYMYNYRDGNCFEYQNAKYCGMECANLGNAETRDDCFMTVALREKNKEFCQSIEDQAMKTDCSNVIERVNAG